MSAIIKRLRGFLRAGFAYLKKHILKVLVITAAIFLVWVVLTEGWGFEGYIDADGKLQRGKTVWDWMELFIIPAVLAGAARFYNRQERENERDIAEQRRRSDNEIAENRNQEAVLQNYFDKMDELVLDRKLMEVEGAREKITVRDTLYLTREEVKNKLPNELRAAYDMAQVRTSTTLRQVNSGRRNIVTQFIHDASLANFVLAGVSLDKADLTQTNLQDFNLIHTNLHEANLSEANLNRSNMREADLSGAKLMKASLRQAILRDANLKNAELINAQAGGTDLRDTRLIGADLREANLDCSDLTNADLTDAKLNNAILTNTSLNNAVLVRADLTGVNFYGSDLSGCVVEDKQLATVRVFEGAIMPDGKRFDPAIHTFWKEMSIRWQIT